MWRTWFGRTYKTNNIAINYELQKIMGGDDVDEGPPAMIFQPFEISAEADDAQQCPIIVRGPWANQYECVRRDVDDVRWHGRCRLCRAHLVIDEFCPCGLYRHDHCQSVYLRPFQCDCYGNKPGIRVCFQCYQLLASNTIITVKYDEAQLFLYAAVSGNLLASIDRNHLPARFEQFQHVAIAAAAQSIDKSSNNGCDRRLAADGYAYTKLQFSEYYFTYGEEMWELAKLRTLSIRLIVDHGPNHCKPKGVMTRDEYLGLLPPSIPSEDAHYVCNLSCLQLYISPFLWPHEPVGQQGETFEEWIQLRHIRRACRSDNKKTMEARMTLAYRKRVTGFNSAPDTVFYTVMACGHRAVAFTNCFRQQSVACAENDIPTPTLSEFITIRRKSLLEDSSGYEISSVSEPPYASTRTLAGFPMYPHLAPAEAEESCETFDLHFPWYGDVGTLEEF
jgi:hypothetical protein